MGWIRAMAFQRVGRGGTSGREQNLPFLAKSLSKRGDARAPWVGLDLGTQHTACLRLTFVHLRHAAFCVFETP